MLTNAALKEQKKQDRKNLHGSKNRKISRKKKEETLLMKRIRNTLTGLAAPHPFPQVAGMFFRKHRRKRKTPIVRGSYKRMKADKSVCHDSDFSPLPKDAIIIKTLYNSYYIIIGRIRSKLDVLLSPTHPPRGELMDKAVNYLQVFWKQLFAYLNDGRYDIDNSIAERFIRPLAGERKNSLFFVSSRMANVSAAYHTLLSTCRMNGLSALEYLKRFFHEIVKGRTDYENLLPMTIGINTNKL